MKETLEALKATIENALNVDMNKLSRKREFTYARAIFCKIAREVPINGKVATYNQIGSIIKKNHATVLHLERKTFYYAIQDSNYNSFYRTVKDIYAGVVNEEGVDFHESVMESLSEIDILKAQNEQLKKQIMIQGVVEERVSNQLATLDKKDVEVVIQKIETIVKAVKKVRQQFGEATVFHYE